MRPKPLMPTLTFAPDAIGVTSLKFERGMYQSS
jgi:hypothetical protein